MLKFRYRCTDENRVREGFEAMMLRDRPCAKELFGYRYLKGIHFRECGERIVGFYVTQSETFTRGGASTRISFRGRFMKKNGETFFEVYIYPEAIPFLLFLSVYVSISAVVDRVGFFFVTAIFIAFMIGYIKGVKETADFFAQWIR